MAWRLLTNIDQILALRPNGLFFYFYLHTVFDIDHFSSYLLHTFIYIFIIYEYTCVCVCACLLLILEFHFYNILNTLSFLLSTLVHSFIFFHCIFLLHFCLFSCKVPFSCTVHFFCFQFLCICFFCLRSLQLSSFFFTVLFSSLSIFVSKYVILFVRNHSTPCIH